MSDNAEIEAANRINRMDLSRAAIYDPKYIKIPVQAYWKDDLRDHETDQDWIDLKAARLVTIRKTTTWETLEDNKQ